MVQTRRVALVVGASRGIGRQVAIDLARNGHAVGLAAKTTSDAYGKAAPFPPDPNSQQSTINTVQREIIEAGGEAMAFKVDVRNAHEIKACIDDLVKSYGGLDVLIYNSGAIWWSSVEQTSMKRFQLMQRINPEGLYAAIQASLPHFKANGWNGRIIVISPPIYSRFFRGKAAYAMGKGHEHMAITSLWPAAAIQSAATRDTKPSQLDQLRKPKIFSDAILGILDSPAKDVNGRLEVDEDFLRRQQGITDFSAYAVVPGSTPRRIMPSSFPDLTVPEQDDEGQRRDSNLLRSKI